jgi:hypothetical protein
MSSRFRENTQIFEEQNTELRFKKGTLKLMLVWFLSKDWLWPNGAEHSSLPEPSMTLQYHRNPVVYETSGVNLFIFPF